MSGDFDSCLSFALPDRHARGRLVRLGPVLDTILAAHGYPAAIETVLAEGLVLTALLGSTLKGEGGQLTLQAQTEAGAIELLVCDYQQGALRGYVKFDSDKLAQLPTEPTLFALFGKGYLAITFDQAATGERYQGIVPLEGVSLGDAAQAYFCQSEQIPSLVRLSMARDAAGCRAGGLMLQHLPEGEEGRERLHVRMDHPEWDHVRILGETIQSAELTDPALPLESLTWRLFNEEQEVRVFDRVPLTRGCRCDPDYIRDVIGRFPASERAKMTDDTGMIHVDCAFCARTFALAITD